MSAIAGIIRFDGEPVAPGVIERVIAALESRGPDGGSHWVRGPVALGHAMLRTTPESRDERQPLLSADGNRVLVMDGRLDNRGELRHDLESRGARILCASDAGLVLAAWETWEEDSPNHLLGDFVFAVYDLRHHALFVARDHVGGRPLYYTKSDRFFAFASDDESLLELPGVSREPCDDMIAHLLIPELEGFYRDQSWLRDIRVMQAAHSITATEDGEFSVRRYWALEPGEPLVFSGPGEASEAFLATFREAVRCRMRYEADIAAMLSGGMDSAGIAATVGETLPESGPRRFDTFSAVQDEAEECIETRCIRRISALTKSRPHEVSVPSMTGTADTGDLVRIAWNQAHPVDNSILLPALMCLAAARNGNRVLLHGVSGDIATWVPDRFARYFLLDGQWRRAWQECRAASRNHTFLQGSSPAELLLRAAWSAWAPKAVKLRLRRLRARGAEMNLDVVNPSFTRQVQLEERLLDQRAAEQRTAHSSLAEEHARQMNAPGYGIAQGLTGYEHVAGHYGVELRDPWADRRVLQFFLDLPVEYKVQDGWTKSLVRQSFEPGLGEMVVRRRDKAHLGRLIKARLMSDSQSHVYETMTNGLDLTAKYVDIHQVSQVYSRYREANGSADREFVYTIMTLVHWLQRISR